MEPSDLVSMAPLEGGWSGETFVANAAGERVVVRLFADPRHPTHAAEIQEALLRLVRGLVPVPRVLEVRHAEPAAGTPGLLVTGWVEGERGELRLAELVEQGDAAALRRAGDAVGRIAATLAGMPQLVAGLFVDGSLAVEPFHIDLSGWVADHEERLALTPADLRSLHEVADSAQDLLGTVERVSLVHGDLNPKNLLLDPGTSEVLAVLDWEFAHAGHPFTDLGNLLRFDRHPAYVEGVLGGFVTVRGGEPGDVLAMARAADLVALVELAARRHANPVAARAHERVLAIARTGDLHAT